MVVKKSGKIVLGAGLNRDEQKALKIEAAKIMAEYDRMNTKEIDAAILWLLMTEFGFGPKRLRKMYDAFGKVMDELCTRYEMPDEDAPWICIQKLKDSGIDLDEWEKLEIDT